MNMFRSQVVCFFFCLFIPSLCLNRHGLKISDNYGPYVVDLDSYKLCKGPKAVNVTQETFYLNKAEARGVFNFTFLVETRIDEVKVFVLSENAKNPLWVYRFKDPCRHFMVASLIQPYLKTENCVVKKGFYSCQFNFNETTKTFLGPSFFYGKFIFKTIVTSKSGNIHCFHIKVLFTKRS